MFVSNLLNLPDEILLEIFAYLLNAHVLYSFYGLNHRLNRCISSYYRHISLGNITYEQCRTLFERILPEIRFEIRSICLDNCRSVLQGKIFAEYFLSSICENFPNLKKLLLVCYTADEFEDFIGSLKNCEFLDEIEVHDLLTDQSNLLKTLIESNDVKWRTIKLKTSYVELPSSPCSTVENLTISIKTADHLSKLLACFPSIRYLNVTIEEISMMEVRFDPSIRLMKLETFSIRCFNHFWLFDELKSLLEILPSVKSLSLQISSQDERLVSSNSWLFEIVPSTVEQLNFALRYFYDSLDEIDSLALSRCRFPMISLIDEQLQQAVIHTIPYRFSLFNLSALMSKQMSTQLDYQHVEMFYDYHGMNLAETFPIISRCRRVKEIAIQSYEQTENVSLTGEIFLSFDRKASRELSLTKKKNGFSLRLESPKIDGLTKFSRLKRIWLLHSSREYQSLKILLEIAPNLSELFIGFDNLLPMLNDPETCQLLSKRIVHLLLLRSAPTAPTTFNETSIPAIVETFQTLRHLQIDVTNGPSIDSIVLPFVHAMEHRFSIISLVVEGKPNDESLKLNTKQWLIERTFLTVHHQFDAQFKQQTSRFLLWM